jgi:hypothetical protein
MIYEKLYINYKIEQDNTKLGFICDPANKKQRETVDDWSKGNYWNKIENPCVGEEIDNIPLTGFKIVDVVSRYSTSNKWYRILDPRGFELEISADNLLNICINSKVNNGLIEDECVWGKNNSAELILTSSEQYKTYCELKESGPVDLVVGEFYKDSKTNVLYMYLGEYTKLIFNKNTCAFRNNEDDLLIVSKLESKQKLKMFVKVFEFYKHSKRYDFVSVSKSVSDRFVKTPESFVFDDSLLNEPVLTTKILRKKLIKDEFKYLYLASSSYGSVFLFKNANDIKTYDFKNDAILNEVNSYIRYTKSEIDFSKINDKNYVDSIIDVYSFDKKPRENANIHSVVFL